MNEQDNNHEFPPGEGGEGQGGEEQLSSGRPAVAAAPGKVLIIGGMAAILIFFVIKSLFFSTKEVKLPPKERPGTVAAERPAPVPAQAQPIMPATIDLPPPNTLPPASEQLTPPKMTPPTIDVNTQSGPTDQQMKQRIRSPMLTGGASGKAAPAEKKKTAANSDPNAAWQDNIAETQAQSVEATQIKHLERTLAQGKIVEGVLETAIDSTLPGDVRAIVSHDTYAENGRSILIPKGSRIVGKYNSAVRKGQARVFIVWTRVIRPDGVDVAINSPGIDSLGRAGMEGFVDEHYFEAFSTAILTSSIDVGFAALGDALFGSQQQTQTTSNGGYTTTSSPTSTAMQTAITNLGSVGQAIVGSVVNITPTIHIDQGQLISIFVNKDVVFPSEGSVLVQ